MADCYLHGYSGGPGGACTRCERDDGELAGYWKSMAENAKHNPPKKREKKEESNG